MGGSGDSEIGMDYVNIHGESGSGNSTGIEAFRACFNKFLKEFTAINIILYPIAGITIFYSVTYTVYT